MQNIANVIVLCLACKYVSDLNLFGKQSYDALMIGSMTVSDEAIGSGQGLTGRGPEGDPLSLLSHRKSGDSLAFFMNLCIPR